MPEQAGEEYQALNSTENSERIDTKEETTKQSKSSAQGADSIVTTTKTDREEVIKTFEKKDINISCSRQTVSHMEVLDVEEQLVQIFCEQVLL